MSHQFFRHLVTPRRRTLLGAGAALALLGLHGCSSRPLYDDPRLPAELSRTLGVSRDAWRWFAAVDWSRHEGWWQQSVGVDALRATFGMFVGDLSSTGLLTDDALVIARAANFSIGYRVLQRIPLSEIERATLLEDGMVVLKRRGAGEVRDYVRVLEGDPWVADQVARSPDLERAKALVRELQARITPTPARWRPPDVTGRDVVALMTPRAIPALRLPPPPGSADKGPVSGTGSVAKGLLGAGQGLGTISPAAGLPFGLAAVVVGAAGSLVGAVQGAVREATEPEARAAKARLDAVQRSGLPQAIGGVLAHRMLLNAVAARLPPHSASASHSRGVLLVPVDEAETGARDATAARAALAEDGFTAVRQLEVMAIELRVVSATAGESTADPQMLMRVAARLTEYQAGVPPVETGKPAIEIEDVGAALPLSSWAQDGAALVRVEFAAACERLAATLADGALSGSRWLGRLS